MAYTGFSKLSAQLKGRGIQNPGALAASIGRKKYGKKKFQQAAARGESLRGARPAKGGPPAYQGKKRKGPPAYRGK